MLKSQFFEDLSKPKIRIIVFLFLAFVALLGFEEVADDVFRDIAEGDHEAIIFDESISAQVQSFRTPMLTQAMVDLTAMGSVSVIATLSVIFFSWLVSYRDFRGLFYFSMILIGAAGLPVALKLLFARERPDLTSHLVEVTNYSFPSGHAFGAAAVYIGLAYYGSKFCRNYVHEIFFYFMCIVLIAIVGTSRIYLGVHFPTDVIAGLCGGAAYSLILSSIFEMQAIKTIRLERPNQEVVSAESQYS